jgi:hypothetical protein
MRLVGQFFHSIGGTGTLEWQGQIVGRPTPSLCLVELFDWFMGEPSVRRLVKIEEMAGWLFYPDAASMRRSYEFGPASRLIASDDVDELG